MLRKDIKGTLATHLNSLVTRKGPPCFAVRLARDREQVLITSEEFKQLETTKSKEQEAILNSKLPDHIVNWLEAEETHLASSGFEEKQEACLKAQMVMNQLKNTMKKSARMMKERAFESIRKLLKQRTKEFLSKIDETGFGDRLEKLIVHQAKDTDAALWNKRLLNGLLESLDKMEETILKTVEKSRQKLRDILDSEDNRDLHRAVQRISSNGFSLKKFRKERSGIHLLANASRKGVICLGSAGIARVNRANARKAFGVMDINGSLAIFDAGKDKVIQEKSIKVKGDEFSLSSIDFSPSGSRVLAAICLDKALHAFQSDDLEELDSWRNEKAKEINQARWIDEERILAGFEKPGELLLYKVGNKSPLLRISPKETMGCAIRRLDFSSFERNEVICGADKETRLVFKIGIENNKNGEMKWTHKGHSSWISAISVSSNKSFVLSGADDKRVILARVSNGEILSTFSGFSGRGFFSHNWISGIVWGPDDSRVLVSSWNELVLLEVRSHALAKMDEIKKEEFAGSSIYGLNAFLDSEHPGCSSFALVGDYYGKIIKIPLH